MVPLLGVIDSIPPAAGGGGVAKTLYYRITQSSVVTGTSTVKRLSETPGNAVHNNTGTVHNSNTKNGSNIADDYIVTPLATGTTSLLNSTTPANKGWLFDLGVPGTYDAGTWEFGVQTHHESASPTTNIVANLYVVTATTTAVTKVSQPISMSRSANYTAAIYQGLRVTWQATSIASITLTSGQYLYVELAFRQITSGGQNKHHTHTSETGPGSTDHSSNKYGYITTPAFTAA